MAIVPSLPYTIQNGQPGDATQVMANLSAIVDGVNQNAAHNGPNSDITSLNGMTTPLSVVQGGTGVSSLTSGNLVEGGGSGPFSDSGIAAAEVVTGPASPTAGHVPKFAGSGTAIQDGYTVGTAANDLVQLDSSARLPAVDGSQLIGLPSHAQVFTSSGTFTTPATTNANTVFKITVTAAGGGGDTGGPSNGGGSGGAGATAIKWLTGLAANTAITVTVGTGVNRGNGGNSSIVVGGTTVTADGGGAASAQVGGIGGAATGGDINIAGGDGVTTTGSTQYGTGGASIWGGGGKGNGGGAGNNGSAPGSGGGGGSGATSSGANGIVVIEWMQ